MKLSVIIVNYNVEHFLEQCLLAAERALSLTTGEVIVVDNNSIDGSIDMVKQKFPTVQLIANKENAGFSKANNQGIKISKGEYVLLLNPDTVVEESTFKKVVEFMDKHPEAGGLGVRMIDGKGNFLPESKRGLPTPSVAFYKIFGLSRLFPKSKKFGQYHLGYLDENETNEVEILSGAFMLMRREVLDKVGLLDEAFFMYGEDIDLSYRIIKGGYKNYYFPETTIIHYKGESTKKSSVNYVFVFYNAMVIFAKKHFSEKNAKLFSFLINIAIYLRASLAIAARIIKRSIIPLIDITCWLLAMFGIAHVYQSYADKQFPADLLQYALPAYAIIWSLFVFLSGGYDRPVRLKRIFIGLVVGTIAILSGYALLDKTYQFSRAFILLSALAVTFLTLGLRVIYNFLNISGYNLFKSSNSRFLIVGSKEEYARVSALLEQTGAQTEFIGQASPPDIDSGSSSLGRWNQINQIIDIHKIDELIFCAKDIKAEDIIEKMAQIRREKIDFKIAQPETLFLIGSNSIDTSGDLYMLDVNSIQRPTNKRNKRLLDFGLGVLLLIFSPLIMWFTKAPLRLPLNSTRLMLGKRTLVGYGGDSNQTQRLPQLKQGLLSPISGLSVQRNFEDTATKLDLIYAKDYKVSNDLSILLRGFRELK